ncbi:MAG: hypothetical protein WC455_06010 [Dehalococcoidia bacterium]|jgi:hypothetical protein
MKGKGIKVFGVVMALLLVFSFAATFSVSSTVSAGTQKWTQISIPGTDDMQLAPGTDVGDIAVTPDGGTLFAALYVFDDTLLPSPYTSLNWYVVKSVDGGYTWKNTEYVGDGTPTEPIVAVEVSPAWEDDGIIVVTTAADAYISEKRGIDFQSMGAAAAGVGTILSFDIGRDNDGDATYVLGSNSDVYLLSGFSGWEAQLIYDASTGGYNHNGAGVDGVIDVAFSPNYGEDGVIFAVLNGRAITETTDGTHIRAESDTTVHNWGAYIADGHFIDEETSTRFASDKAYMAFADDYNSQASVFVGLTAYLTPLNPATDARGDAFRVDLVTGAMGTSSVVDLNIRGTASVYKRTNVNSIAVSGSASSAFILAGLSDLSNTGPMSSWQAQIHYSIDGGESWMQCYKPASGLIMSQHTAPIVVMAPDFADSGIAYCGNGFISTNPLYDLIFSGFYVSTTQGTTFNGRGLLDHTIDAITDVVPSPDYDNDSTLFITTYHDSVVSLPNFPPYFGLLWETTNGGSSWELILAMTLMIPLPGLNQETVQVPSTYPDEPSIFVTGASNIGGTAASTLVRSTDEGNLWATTIRGPYDGADPQVINAWVAIDKDTLIVAGGSSTGIGNRIWKTTDMAAHWIETDASDISATETIIEMQIFNDTTIIVSTDMGNVYICTNWETDFSFVQVDKGPGNNAAGDWAYVAFDTNFDDNGIIYAGVWGTNSGIYRIDVNSGDQWTQIYDPLIPEDIYSISCDGNGILWAIADDGVASVAVREVNPTAPIDDIAFEYVTTGLTSDLWEDLETAPTQTYVFAIGGTSTASPFAWDYHYYGTELWAYIDTLIQPTLISPACGTTAAGTIIEGTSTARVSLMWDDLAKAQYYDYEVAYDDGFGSIASSGWLEGTQASVNLFLGEQYYWRVRVNGSVFSKWSEICSFTTPLGPASAKPVITYPGGDDSHNNIELTPSLTWTSTVACTGYELMVAANCDWSNPIVNLTGSSAIEGCDNTCYAITQALQEGTNYCWRVRAVNSDTDTMSPWSDTGTFTTLVTPEEEDEGTPIWVWVVIALSAVLLVGVVVLIIRTRRPV